MSEARYGLAGGLTDAPAAGDANADMPQFGVLRPSQREAWLGALGRTAQHDFYHLPDYHALAEREGEGAAHLFTYREGAYVIALPLLVRPIAAHAGLLEVGEGWYDATSVSGYAGPVCSHTPMPEAVLGRFRDALCAALQERRIVAVFSRLHPLIAQGDALAGLGQQVPTGQTVSIDLTISPAAQTAGYRKNHLRDIAKLDQMGVRCLHDEAQRYRDEFVDIYYETMRRVDATSAYLFPPRYFEALLARPDADVHLFVATLGGSVICGGLMTLCDGIAQYHLGGTRDEYLRLAPMKLLLDTARRWATGREARIFHLGGGVGGQEDSLFRFKTGFSTRRHEFLTWRWVLLPERYELLCEQATRWTARHGLRRDPAPYSPAYRRPAEPIGELCLLA